MRRRLIITAMSMAIMETMDIMRRMTPNSTAAVEMAEVDLLEEGGAVDVAVGDSNLRKKRKRSPSNAAEVDEVVRVVAVRGNTIRGADQRKSPLRPTCRAGGKRRNQRREGQRRCGLQKDLNLKRCPSIQVVMAGVRVEEEEAVKRVRRRSGCPKALPLLNDTRRLRECIRQRAHLHPNEVKAVIDVYWVCAVIFAISPRFFVWKHLRDLIFGRGNWYTVWGVLYWSEDGCFIEEECIKYFEPSPLSPIPRQLPHSGTMFERRIAVSCNHCFEVQ